MDIHESTALIITYVFSFYALFLTISGTIGNLFASVVCFRLNKVSTFKILSVLFIFEPFTLYTVSRFEIFTNNYFKTNLLPYFKK